MNNTQIVVSIRQQRDAFTSNIRPANILEINFNVKLNKFIYLKSTLVPTCVVLAARPLAATRPTKLRTTSTHHMITPGVLLHRRFAVRASFHFYDAFRGCFFRDGLENT